MEVGKFYSVELETGQKYNIRVTSLHGRSSVDLFYADYQWLEDNDVYSNVTTGGCFSYPKIKKLVPIDKFADKIERFDSIPLGTRFNTVEGVKNNNNRQYIKVASSGSRHLESIPKFIAVELHDNIVWSFVDNPKVVVFEEKKCCKG